MVRYISLASPSLSISLPIPPSLRVSLPPFMSPSLPVSLPILSLTECASDVRNSIGIWLHLLNVLLYAAFLGCYTSVIILVGPGPAPWEMNVTGNSSQQGVPQVEQLHSDYRQRV